MKPKERRASSLKNRESLLFRVSKVVRLFRTQEPSAVAHERTVLVQYDTRKSLLCEPSIAADEIHVSGFALPADANVRGFGDCKTRSSAAHASLNTPSRPFLASWLACRRPQSCRRAPRRLVRRERQHAAFPTLGASAARSAFTAVHIARFRAAGCIWRDARNA
jgi:hypothetical protein